MPKNWNNLSETEKIEELRNFVLQQNSRINALAADVRAINSKLKEIGEAVEALEDQSPKAHPKKKTT